MCSTIPTSLERIHVKNYKGLEILLYLQANKLANYSFMDVSGRHKTPGPEMKDS